MKMIETIPTDIQILFEYVVEKNFDEFLSLPKMRLSIENDFLLNKKSITNKKEYQDYLEIISGINFFDKENYISIPDIKTMRNLQSFRSELLIFLSYKYNKEKIDYTLTRQISPPLWAYEYIGFSIKIKPTGKEFASLFG